MSGFSQPPPSRYPPESHPYPPVQSPHGGGPVGPYQVPNNGMAVASMVFGILGLTFLYGIGAILALILGYVSKGQIDRSQGHQGGRGFAVAGIIMGWIGLALTVLFVAFFVSIFAFAVNEAGGIEGIKEEFEAGVAEGSMNIDPAAAGCTPVRQFPSEGRAHVPEGTNPSYNTDPPTSGSHYEIPAQTFFYDDPIARETLVHNLEHGQIVIWYNPDASELVKTQIEVLWRQEFEATVAVPYEREWRTNNLVLTAWRASQECRQPSQQAVDHFRRRFQGRGPEPIAPAYTG